MARAAANLGITLSWRGTGEEEVGVVERSDLETVKAGQVIVKVDPVYYRPAEVESLVGDAAKARRKLGWAPRSSFDDLVAEMTQADLALARREQAALGHGLKVYRPDLEQD